MSDERLGLALSGGGLRAALFHLGVMAQLARRHVLSNVRVLSTVSGGSIVGAYYVLALERELRLHDPSPLDPEDYVVLLKNLEHEFLKAAQIDLRMRTFSNLTSNLKMIRASYSRSDRLGEVLDREIFWQALNEERGPRGGRIALTELGDIERKRGDAVPHLILNATSLNTGHAWRFEADTMGEWTPGSVHEWDVDRSAVYGRPASYQDMVARMSEMPLGTAVAASAAVPGLFHPLAITGLYEDQIELVDGGVFDNQGVDALLDAHCSHIIVSDAGGQMGSTRTAPASFLGVSLRSSGIQYGRIRQLTLERLQQHPGTHRVAVIHTRRGVRPGSYGWRGANGAFEAIPASELPPAELGPVHNQIQERLADIRTDLDVFNDVESMALMLSGFRQAEAILAGASDPVLSGGPTDVGPFAFEQLAPLMDAAPNGRFAKLLKAGKNRFLKELRLAPARALLWSVPVYAPVIGIVVVLGYLVQGIGIRTLSKLPLIGDVIQGIREIVSGKPFWWALVSFVSGLAVTYAAARYASLLFRLPVVGSQFQAVSRVTRSLSLLARTVVAVLGFALAWPSMLLFDPLYRKVGRVTRLRLPS